MVEIEENLVVNSEDENEINLLNVKKSRVRNRCKILESDSEPETETIADDNMSKEVTEDENSSETGLKDEVKKRKQRAAVLDSDAETSGEEISPHNKSFPDEETAVETIIYTTNNKGELISENTSTHIIQKSCLSSLCDADTSEDEQTEKSTVEYSEDTVIEPKVYKRSRKSKKDDQPKKMTTKEAAQQRFEIHSESQRMIRESNVSLPYHKPKSYTLKEFLQKRSKLASAASIIPKAPPPVAIKMSRDQLEEVSKKLDERIKQVEEFYKSESEGEDKEDNREELGQEITSWLDLLVDNAINSVESKNEKLTNEEKDANKTEEQQLSMDYEFNLDDSDEPEIPRKPNVSELLKEKLNIKPKLSGCPDDVIDLDKGIARPSEVKKLVEKFFQHSVKKIPQRHKVELNIVGITGGGEIIKETVSMNVDKEEESVVVETPGAKLQKLREELQNQMAQRRSELWKQKQEQGDCITAGKKINDEDETGKDVLDDDDEEEEFEMTESESEDTEDDEEDYSLKPEKSKPKSTFLDDEADVDEEENDEIEHNEEDDIDENNGFDGDDEEVPENDDVDLPKKKILKRILKPFTEESDDDEDEEPIGEIAAPQPAKNFHHATASSEDDSIPPNLPRTDITPQKPHIDKAKSDFDFLTPVSFLTGLQNLNSDSKFSKDSPIISPFRAPYEPSPLKEDSGFHKKLFSEQSSQDSQSNVENLAEAMMSDDKEETVPTSQDLLDVCSGNFSGELESGRIQERTSEKVEIRTNPESEIKCLDEDHDQIISQLLDEEELERFKKKFESPVTKATDREDAEEANATGLISSDDENEGLEIRTKKKKRKKLVFSDDEEDSVENVREDEERIDLYDSDDEEQLLENEIKAQEAGNYKPTDFLDKEAELSESEWGSADEDEKGLDELEFEQGDEETFNENKVRSELERIHMRQILDEDNREVKILQELLLEDGEMHGTGRQRQFRWKALDSLDNSEFEKRDDDDIYLDEEENEEQFRKMRHKREMFLKKKSTTDDVESILSDSQILKIGQQVFKSSQSSSSQNNANKPEEKEPFSLLSKRGSFLSRKDQVLQRLAEYNKVTNPAAGSASRNSRCFVFQTVETGETVAFKNNNKKRKATDGTPNAIKKLRLSDLSPAINKKQSGKAGGAKKLLGNW